MTLVSEVYDRFFDIVTDDLGGTLDNEEDFMDDCKSLLRSSIPMFEFPTHVLTMTTVTVDGEEVEVFEHEVTSEEMNILAMGMGIIWTQRQTTSIELTRQKYSGNDFKLTSQAAQLQRLMALHTHCRDEHRRLQMIHTRREEQDGRYVSTFGRLVTPITPVDRYPVRRRRDKGVY